jgi:hypothetical protein
VNFPVDLCMSTRNQYKITCYTYLRLKYIIFIFHCHFIRYNSILFLYYVNIYTYPCQATYFKTHEIGIPEVLYVFGARRWLKRHVRPSDNQTWLHECHRSFTTAHLRHGTLEYHNPRSDRLTALRSSYPTS